MATKAHSTLTGAELHEPKGADSASANTVYVADGAGSGAWTSIFEYGEITTLESDAVSVSSINGTPSTLPFSNDGQSQGITADAANNRLTVADSGVYFITFTISFSTTSSADAGLYEFKVLDDGTSTGIEMARQMSGTADTGAGGASGLASLGAGSHITVSVESDGTSDDIDLYNCHLTAFKVS